MVTCQFSGPVREWTDWLLNSFKKDRLGDLPFVVAYVGTKLDLVSVVIVVAAAVGVPVLRFLPHFFWQIPFSVRAGDKVGMDSLSARPQSCLQAFHSRFSSLRV